MAREESNERMLDAALGGFIGGALRSGSSYAGQGIDVGMIFGVFLYKAEGKKIFVLAPVSKLCVNVFVNILLNTCWLKIFTGKAYMVLMSARIVKNVAIWPIESIILILIVLFVSKNRRRLIK